MWARLAARARGRPPAPACRAAGPGPQPAPDAEFEPVFSLPHIRAVSMFNRLKLYPAAGAALAVPGCAALASLGMLDSDAALVSAYVGVTSTALLSIASFFTRNIIGFLYISKDNQYVKISFVDYWGRRKDKVVPVSDWVPLSELPSRNTDPFYLSPQLESDKIRMKLIVKMGKTLNPKKVGELLE